MCLFVLGSAFEVLLDFVVGICFLVVVFEEHVVAVRDRVVRDDDTVESAIPGAELADFSFDKSISCGAQAFDVVVSVVAGLSCLWFEGDRCSTDTCGTCCLHGS